MSWESDDYDMLLNIKGVLKDLNFTMQEINRTLISILQQMKVR